MTVDPTTVEVEGFLLCLFLCAESQIANIGHFNVKLLNPAMRWRA